MKDEEVLFEGNKIITLRNNQVILVIETIDNIDDLMNMKNIILSSSLKYKKYLKSKNRSVLEIGDQWAYYDYSISKVNFNSIKIQGSSIKGIYKSKNVKILKCYGKDKRMRFIFC